MMHLLIINPLGAMVAFRRPSTSGAGVPLGLQLGTDSKQMQQSPTPATFLLQKNGIFLPFYILSESAANPLKNDGI
jgi:hypothetical protein